MSTNMTLITSVTVGSGGAASVTLPATGTIPATYTDLKVVYSARSTQASIAVGAAFTFNASTSNFSSKILYGSGSSASSFSQARYAGSMPGSTATASTFSNNEIYIPNYTSSNYKSYSVDTVTENNATESYAYIAAGLWSDTPALTSLTLTPDNGTFVEGSTFYLYGISNVTSTTKATGGIVSSDGTYNYHMFPFSGTFTPTENITADYLVVAGGGGGGTYTGGGGGAGGLVFQTGQSLTAQGYSVVIGAGGAGGKNNSSAGGSRGSSGVDSTFNSLTATGGGGGAIWNPSQRDGGNGGSGGGGGENAGAGTGGASTQTSYSSTGFGNAGGAGTGSYPYAGGGGGGAGAVGAAANGSGGGDGGVGKQYSDFASATGTGANSGYYAGGGGGASSVLATYDGVGGLGGGGNAINTIDGQAGTVNTGGGGGAGSSGSSAGIYYGGAGGSGIVIIRYAI